jgi:hypothetical protein
MQRVYQKYLGPLSFKVEKKLRPRSTETEPTPVWIIGPPRSGSTLLYNSLVNTYRFTYFSNFAAELYYSPYLALSIERYLPFSKNSSYQFDQGDTKKLAAPHESWKFLYRWFPEGYENVYLTEDDISEKDAAEFRQTMQSLIALDQGPFILKNTFNSMRIKALRNIFPQSLFIVCQRDPVDIAQSIFRARKATGDVKQWFGAAPKEFNDIKSLEIHEQIVKQVYYINRQIEEDEKNLGLSDDMVYVRYKDFCQDTKAAMEEISDFLERHSLILKQINSVPSHFDYRSGRSVEKHDYQLFMKEFSVLSSMRDKPHS